MAYGRPNMGGMNQKQMMKQGSMKVIHVSETVMEIFEVTGFVDILTIE